MKKLDTLIDRCRRAEQRGTKAFDCEHTSEILRILEAVREDMGIADTNCRTRNREGACSGFDTTTLCRVCPRIHHADVRAALEQL